MCIFFFIYINTFEFFLFFFNDTATTEIYTLSYTLSLHDALPIYHVRACCHDKAPREIRWEEYKRSEEHTSELQSHSEISYAVFCLKKKNRRQRGPSSCHDRPGRCAHAYGCRGRPAAVPHCSSFCFFFFNDTATTEIYTLSYTLSLHDALPIYSSHIQKSRMPSSACDWS